MNQENNGPVKNGQEYRLQNITRQTKIAVIAGIALLAASMLITFVYSSVAAEQMETAMALNQYRLGSKTLTSSVQSYAITGDRKYYDAYMKELNEDRNRDMAWEILQKNHITAGEWEKLNQIAQLSQQLVPLEEEAMEEAHNGQTEAAIRFVFGDEYKKTVDQISALTDESIAQIQQREMKKAALLKTIQILFQLLFLASFLYVIHLTMQTIRFSRNDLLTPVLKASAQMTALAQGDFHRDLDLSVDDTEVGRMAGAMFFMKSNLVNMIGEISDILEQMSLGCYQATPRQEYVGEFIQIKESLLKISETMQETLTAVLNFSEQIDKGSGQLSDASENLAENCTVQAARVAELVELLDEMTQDIETNAQSAQESVDVFSHAEKALATGNARMQDLKSAIGEISKCTEQIEGIIEAIQDISFQTDLLSLNAAIEAARAGESGKGFAVVAQQVKKLSEESSQATGNTTKLIETTLEAVNKGIAMADNSVANMAEILSGAKDTTEKMKQIASLLKADANQMRVFHQHILSVSGIVDNNAAAAEETAAISSEQKTQVGMMVALLEQFKV